VFDVRWDCTLPEVAFSVATRDRSSHEYTYLVLSRHSMVDGRDTTWRCSTV